MGLIPGYENDIFISYAHNDNLPVYSLRWVELLHDNLENLLIQRLGEKPAIWRDRRMDQTDLIEGLLDSRVNTSALMLAIVSPSYLKSKWCGWEREKFVENAERRGGLRVANKSRIVKVVKTHVERTSLPNELQETLGGEFLRHDQAAGKYVELDPQSIECRQKLEALADSIKSLIEAFRDHAAAAVPLTKDKTVYLAETDPELDTERDDIKREFEQNGYHILPSVELPPKATAAALEEKVRDYLKSARVSVHLLGANYGVVPSKGAGRSIVRIQHEAAQQHDSDPAFKQVLWIPKGLEESQETEPEQKDFITKLLASSSALRRAEVLRGDIEELKTYVHNLFKPPPKSVLNFKGNGSIASVYLICDKNDYEETGALEKYLTEQRCEVLPPLLEGDAEEVTQYHRDSLLECDAFLVYY
ncbi:MAG: toll/interleukin-1 receptor domain-containing protein, partial [Blastocatellia bacterium]